jgi:hypothetical protein
MATLCCRPRHEARESQVKDQRGTLKVLANFSSGLPERNPGLKLANAFSVRTRSFHAALSRGVLTSLPLDLAN